MGERYLRRSSDVMPRPGTTRSIWKGCAVSEPCADMTTNGDRFTITGGPFLSSARQPDPANCVPAGVEVHRLGEHVAGPERLEALSDYVARQFAPMRLWTENIECFQAQMRSTSLGVVQLYDVFNRSPLVVARTRKLIGSSDPDFIKVALQLRGASILYQGDREATLRPGDFVLCDTGRPYQISGVASGHMRTVMFARDALRLASPQLEKLIARPISGKEGIGALVSRYLVSLGQLFETRVCTSWHLSEATLDLLSAAFADQLGDANLTGLDGGKAGLVVRVRAFIEQHLGDPQLDLAIVAKAHHMSIRSLQKLFEGQGQTVSGWIRAQRLEHCRRDLANPALGDQPVSTVAARWGLVDAAHFSRLFKSRYGIPPRDYRNKAFQRLHAQTTSHARQV